MTRIAILGDTHFGVRNDSPVFYDYMERSLKDFFKVIDAFDIKHVIHLGDLFDRRKYVNFKTANACRKYFLEPLEERGVETYILCGNHDQYYKNTHEINALNELIAGKYNNIYVYDEPIIEYIGGEEMLLMPWITESNQDASMDLLSKAKVNLVMGHFEVQGIEMFRGSISDHGLDRNVFDRFELVCSGHYHHRSIHGSLNYIGALGEYIWSDHNDPRGFSVFDTRSRELTFHQNRNHMFNMIYYDDVKENMLLKAKTDLSMYSNVYVKLVTVQKTNHYAFDVFFDALEKVGPLNISVIDQSSMYSENEESDENEQVEDTQTILSNYITGLTLPVDNDRMKTYMHGIYQEALTLESIE